MSELEDALIETNHPADLTADNRDSWAPTDLASADWVARKAVKASRRLLAIKAEADRISRQAYEWADRERVKHDATIGWAHRMLEGWLAREIAGDDSKKPLRSRSLPCGVSVKVTAGRESLQVVDEEALVGWMADNTPDLLTFVPKFSKADVKKAMRAAGDVLVDDGGEVIPGVKVEVGPDTYRVDVGGAL